jgi:hypothetical protein
MKVIYGSCTVQLLLLFADLVTVDGVGRIG